MFVSHAHIFLHRFGSTILRQQLPGNWWCRPFNRCYGSDEFPECGGKQFLGLYTTKHGPWHQFALQCDWGLYSNPTVLELERLDDYLVMWRWLSSSQGFSMTPWCLDNMYIFGRSTLLSEEVTSKSGLSGRLWSSTSLHRTKDGQ